MVAAGWPELVQLVVFDVVFAFHQSAPTYLSNAVGVAVGIRAEDGVFSISKTGASSSAASSEALAVSAAVALIELATKNKERNNCVQTMIATVIATDERRGWLQQLQDSYRGSPSFMYALSVHNTDMYPAVASTTGTAALHRQSCFGKRRRAAVLATVEALVVWPTS